jgi:hypothetical protein
MIRGSGPIAPPRFAHSQDAFVSAHRESAKGKGLDRAGHFAT